MKERPILFSGPMVRAILNGRKTVTRRIVKPVGDDGGFVLLDHGNGWWPYRSDDGDSGFHTVKRGGKLYQDETPHACPYGKPGDRLWVREAWAAHWMYNDVPPSAARSDRCDQRRSDNRWYAADPENSLGSDGAGSVLRGKWRPSIHMPKWASRILLEVVSVRVERLTTISVSDAIAEGYDGSVDDPIDPSITWYSRLWESINGAGSWAANPWVWAITFKRVDMEAACRS